MCPSYSIHVGLEYYLHTLITQSSQKTSPQLRAQKKYTDSSSQAAVHVATVYDFHLSRSNTDRRFKISGHLATVYDFHLSRSKRK